MAGLPRRKTNKSNLRTLEGKLNAKMSKGMRQEANQEASKLRVELLWDRDRKYTRNKTLKQWKKERDGINGTAIEPKVTKPRLSYLGKSR